MAPAVQIHWIGTVSAITIETSPTLTLRACYRAPAQASKASSSVSFSTSRLR
jgi:hypothetical protein